jgi:hypothetical protein
VYHNADTKKHKHAPQCKKKKTPQSRLAAIDDIEFNAGFLTVESSYAASAYTNHFQTNRRSTFNSLCLPANSESVSILILLLNDTIVSHILDLFLRLAAEQILPSEAVHSLYDELRAEMVQFLSVTQALETKKLDSLVTKYVFSSCIS